MDISFIPKELHPTASVRWESRWHPIGEEEALAQLNEEDRRKYLALLIREDERGLELLRSWNDSLRSRVGFKDGRWVCEIRCVEFSMIMYGDIYEHELELSTKIKTTYIWLGKESIYQDNRFPRVFYMTNLRYLSALLSEATAFAKFIYEEIHSQEGSQQQQQGEAEGI